MPLVQLQQHTTSASCDVPAVEPDCAEYGCRTPVGPAPDYVALTDFGCLVTPYATFKDSSGERFAAPDAAIARAVLDTLTDFTRRTRILRRVAYKRTQPGVRDYYIKPNDNELISTITRVVADGCCIHDYNDRSCCGTENKFTFALPDCIIVGPSVLHHSYPLEVRYVAEVTRDAKLIDRILLDRYSSAITMGAAARLQMLPGWEWSRPEYAIQADSVYNSGVASAMTQVALNFTSGERSAITKHRF